MKKKALLLLVWALAVTISTYAQSDSPYLTKTFSGRSLSNLRVETSGGSISVVGDQGSGVKVEMYIHPNNWNGKSTLSKEEIEERLEDYIITIQEEGNTVIARAERKNKMNNDWKRSLSIAFKVYTPRTFATDLRTSGGSIQLASLTGEQHFTTSGGSIKATDLSGNIKGRTSGGSIEVAKCTQNIDLVTSGGSIRANDLEGKISLKTSGGSISLTSLNGDIVATTSGGGVRADGIQGALNTSTSGGSIKMSNLAASVKARTSAGSIEADFDRLGEYVSLSTSAGSVRVNMPLNKGLDLDLRGNKVSIPLKNFDGRADKDRVQGSMNGGGIPVTLTASSGSVYVN